MGHFPRAHGIPAPCPGPNDPRRGVAPGPACDRRDPFLSVPACEEFEPGECKQTEALVPVLPPQRPCDGFSPGHVAISGKFLVEGCVLRRATWRTVVG